MFATQRNKGLENIKGRTDDILSECIIVIGDLFQLEPLMDGYKFKHLQNSDYTVLAPSLWQKHFSMFELTEIMRR